MARSSIAEALTELRKILVTYERNHQAEAISKLLHWQVTDAARFENELVKNDLWTGPRAIYMVSFYESSRQPLAVVRDAEVRFRNAIIRLVEAMDAQGLRNLHAQKVASRMEIMNKLSMKQSQP